MRPSDELAQLEDLARAQQASAPPLARALEDAARMRYEFRSSDGRHVTWAEARRRGYAACGEAAAYLAAAAAREGRAVELALVTGDPVECGPGYRHAVAVVDGVPLDVYAGRACPAPAVPLAVAAVEGETMFGDCECRAAGLSTYQTAVQGVCGVPGMAAVLSSAHALVRLTSIEEAANVAADIARMLGLDVSQRELDALWDALDGLLSMCDQSRAAGWQGDTLRGTADAVDMVSAAALPLHAAAAAIGASGLLVKVVGATVTAGIGATMAAVVGACQILDATGVTDEMRAAAAELDTPTRDASARQSAKKKASDVRDRGPGSGSGYSGANRDGFSLIDSRRMAAKKRHTADDDDEAPAPAGDTMGKVLAWAGALGTAATIIGLIRGR